MAEKRQNRWLVRSFLALGLVSLLSVTFYPIIQLVQSGGTSSVEPSPSPIQSASAQPQINRSELEAQARGYEGVLQKEPDNQTALRELLRVKAQLRDAKGAIAPLERLVKLNPGVTDYSVLLAQTKQEAGDPEGAAQIYRDVLKTDSGNVKALDGYSALLVQQKQSDRAVTLLQDTLKSAPQLNKAKPGSVDLVSTHLILGYVYDSQKQYDEAIAVYDEASKLDAKDFRPVLRKALALQAQGKTEAAKAAFESAKTLAPADFKGQIDRLAQTPTQPTPAPKTPATPTVAPSAK